MTVTFRLNLLLLFYEIMFSCRFIGFYIFEIMYVNLNYFEIWQNISDLRNKLCTSFLSLYRNVYTAMQYFNYMGMLAVEGTYDKMDKLLSQNIHPVDILLMMAASEGDKPKIEELLRAGASYTVKDANGLTALDKAGSEEIKDFIRGFSAQKA